MAMKNGMIYRMDSEKNEEAFKISEEEKIRIITQHFGEIMRVLGLDLTDDSLRGTPARVARMYVKEIFSGLDPAKKPRITLFDNGYQYRQMLVEKDISLHSTCEHHFVPIIGKAHVAYIPAGKVIGLSKINRIVEYYAKRPQIQERLTVQIAKALKQGLETENVAVMIEATHLCVASRGIKDNGSSTVTSDYSGVFLDGERREEFLKNVKC